MVVAGDSLLIEGWMKWFHAPVWNFLDTPALNRLDEQGKLGTVIIHLVLANGKIMMPEIHPAVDQPLEFNGEARFVGTGARHAYDCFAINKCVETSVRTASKFDVYTGGPSLHTNVKDGASPATAFDSSAQALREMMLNRGTVMNRKTLQPVGTLSDFAARQSGMDNAAAANLSNFVISAPTGVPAFVWSQDQKSELMKAFAEMAVLEEELNSK